MNKLAMPFDQYQRYEICKRIIDDFKNNKKRELKILDVGGHFRTKGGVNWLPAVEFFGENEVLVVDTTEVSMENYQVSDGRDLPFDDSSFDVVVSNDVLEHVPPEGRYEFIKELIRVSKELVVINFPYYTAKNALAEKILYEYIVSTTNGENRMLEEHLINGLPKVQDVISELSELSIPFSYYYSGDTDNWLKLMAISYELSRLSGANLQEIIDEYVNDHHFLNEMNLNEGYRVTFIVDKNGVMVKNNFFETIKREKKSNLVVPAETILTYFGMKRDNENKSVLDSYYYDADKILGRTTHNTVIRQTFKCNSPNLCRMSFLLATYKENLKGQFSISLLEEASAKCVFKTTVDFRNFEDNEWFDVDFTPLLDSRGKEYVIEITQLSKDLGPSLYYSPNNNYGKGSIDNAPIPGNLSLRTYCRKMNAAEQYFLIDQQNNALKEESMRQQKKIIDLQKEIVDLQKKNVDSIEEISELSNIIEGKDNEITNMRKHNEEIINQIQTITNKYNETKDKYSNLIKILKEI